MDTTTLKNKNVQATFAPLQGMNLMSLQIEGVDIIDQKTLPLFEDRFAGLGCLIGPHFHHREDSKITPVPSEELFPHIARVKAKGTKEPFSHGIGRYAPWKFDATKEAISAKLSSEDLWNNVSLKTLEGFAFEMEYSASLLENGILIDYSINAKEPSLVGLHYYYTLPKGEAKVSAAIEHEYREQNKWKPIDPSFLDKEGYLSFDANQEVDVGFIPKKRKDGFEIFYENAKFILKVSFTSKSKDTSWQLYRPKDASYICIEPLSTKHPRQPTSNKSHLQVKIEVLEIKE